MTDLADAGMAFPADPAGAVAVGVASLADAELVTTGVTNGVDATPMNDRNSYGSHDGPVLTDMWCGGEILIRNDWPDMLIGSVNYDPLDVKYAMLADNHGKVFGKFSSDQVCPVVPEMHDWERREALGDMIVDRYGYYGDFDSRSGSSDYDDPRDYREWCDWSDIEDDEGYCDPFLEEVGNLS